MAEHSTLTGAELHEPKGAASATSGQVYVSNGAGSGTWTKPAASNVTVTDAGGYYTGTDVESVLQELGPKINYVTLRIDDVSTASAVFFPLPVDCVINQVTTVLTGTISVADATITISRGGDSATLGTITVAYSGSLEGDIDENASLSNNTVTKATHKYIKIATDGASTGTVSLFVTIKFTV